MGGDKDKDPDDYDNLVRDKVYIMIVVLKKNCSMDDEYSTERYTF